MSSKPTANWQDGLDATVMAITANQAAIKQQKIMFENGRIKEILPVRRRGGLFYLHPARGGPDPLWRATRRHDRQN